MHASIGIDTTKQRTITVRTSTSSRPHNMWTLSYRWLFPTRTETRCAPRVAESSPGNPVASRVSIALWLSDPVLDSCPPCTRYLPSGLQCDLSLVLSLRRCGAPGYGGGACGYLCTMLGGRMEPWGEASSSATATREHGWIQDEQPGRRW